MLVDCGLHFLINVTPAILAATLGFGIAARVTRLTAGRGMESA
ncbi:MAG TPA: hypothetical protein VEA77_06735 [Hyphomicrobium sp.]|nr:hypothetical protein [Hyphomicrobium sp.]